MQEPQPLGRNFTEEKIDPGRALPPGRARFATRPILTGFSATPKTIGIVVVAALAASAAGVPPGVADRTGPLANDRHVLTLDKPEPSNQMSQTASASDWCRAYSM